MYKLFVFLTFLLIVFADNNFDESKPSPMGDKEIVLALLCSTTGGPYIYSQSGHHLYGTAFDGTYIDTYDSCAGQFGSCRNNQSCQCQASVGPLPQGTYTLGNMQTFKGMSYCYELYPSSSNSMCGRSGFLILGGDCSDDPSDGSIVIESESTRYRLKSGATLKVTGKDSPAPKERGGEVYVRAFPRREPNDDPYL